MTTREAPPVVVGFVGAGNVLPAYLEALDRLVARGLATAGPICARRREVRAALLARRPAAVCVASAAEVIEDETVDLVVVLTPPATHPQIVREALAAGRHVVCEKPLASGPDEGADLFAAATAADRVLLAAPFVHLSPTFRRLWTLVRDGEIGQVHAARAHYGNPGSTWAAWYHDDELATLGDVGSYNLKSLAALLGPVVEVGAMSASSGLARAIQGRSLVARDPDTWQLLLRHEAGALSSVLASHATVRYRRPALELYGTDGTANLLGDDWDPQGVEWWREDAGTWIVREPDDATWRWTDGLREAVTALRLGRAPLADPALDVHVLEIIRAAGSAAREGAPIAVSSRFAAPGFLRLAQTSRRHVHDRTRPADEQ
jgi:predicted dehydrogenase